MFLDCYLQWILWVTEGFPRVLSKSGFRPEADIRQVIEWSHALKFACLRRREKPFETRVFFQAKVCFLLYFNNLSIWANNSISLISEIYLSIETKKLGMQTDYSAYFFP